MNDSQDWIAALGLTKHPEGGYYKETYRCPENSKCDEFNSLIHRS